MKKINKKIIEKILHDISTPVTTILNFSDIGNLEFLGIEKILSEITKNSENISLIINAWRTLLLEDFDCDIENYIKNIKDFAATKNITLSLKDNELQFEKIAKIILTLIDVIKIDGSIDVIGSDVFFCSNRLLDLNIDSILQNDIFNSFFDKSNILKFKKMDFNYIINLI